MAPAGLDDRPPTYQKLVDVDSDADNVTSGDKRLQSNQARQNLPETASSSQPQRAEAPTTSKPIIVQLRRRKVADIHKFTVENLGNVEVVVDKKDLLLLDSMTNFEEIRHILLLRARDRGILRTHDDDSEAIWPLISISTNRRGLISDIIQLDHESWEAGRELLSTKEDAILRLDVAVTAKGSVEHVQEEHSEKSDRCIVQ